jgi:hypothetical protein
MFFLYQAMNGDFFGGLKMSMECYQCKDQWMGFVGKILTGKPRFSHFQIMGLSWEMFPEANRKDVQRM